MKKRAQISYEYLLVIGMLLVIAIPFYHTSTGRLGEGYGAQSNEDFLVRLMHAVETAANLGPGSTIWVDGTVDITDAIVSGDRVTLTDSNGKSISRTADGARLFAGHEALEGEFGKGYQRIAVTSAVWPGMVTIGNIPTLVGACSERRVPTVEEIKGAALDGNDCVLADDGQTLKINPTDDVWLVGTNFHKGSITDQVGMTLKSGEGISTLLGGCFSGNPQCTQNSQCSSGQCHKTLCLCAGKLAKTDITGLKSGEEALYVKLIRPSPKKAQYAFDSNTYKTEDNSKTLLINFDYTGPGEGEGEGEGGHEG